MLIWASAAAREIVACARTTDAARADAQHIALPKRVPEQAGMIVLSRLCQRLLRGPYHPVSGGGRRIGGSHLGQLPAPDVGVGNPPRLSHSRLPRRTWWERGMLEAVDMGADSCSHARSQLDRQIGWLRPLQRLGNHAGHMVIADLRARPVTHHPAIASKFRK